MSKEELNGYEKLLEDIINRVECIIDICEAMDLTNEQFFLDFEDKLNKLSIKDHGKRINEQN